MCIADTTWPTNLVACVVCGGNAVIEVGHRPRDSKIIDLAFNERHKSGVVFFHRRTLLVLEQKYCVHALAHLQHLSTPARQVRGQTEQQY